MYRHRGVADGNWIRIQEKKKRERKWRGRRRRSRTRRCGFVNADVVPFQEREREKDSHEDERFRFWRSVCTFLEEARG